MKNDKHAKAIGKIIKAFAKSLGIQQCYFNIKPVKIHQTSPGRVRFSLGSDPEIKKKTVAEIDNLRADLYHQIQRYLIEHKLKTDATIETIYYSWAVHGWRISFVESYEVS